MRIIPDIPPKLFTLSAIAIGYILIDDTTATEQNALGNWLMLVAQVLCTNAYYKQLQNERGSTITDKDILIMLRKMADALNKQMEEIKKNC